NRRAPPGMTQLAQAQQRWPTPFAPRALPRFNTTTRQSAPLRRIGTFGLAVGAACAFSLSIAGQVLTFRTRARLTFAPPPCRMPLGQSQCIPQADPRGMATPWFWHRLIGFRHVISGSLALASLNHTCRNLVRNYERSRGIWTNLFGGSKKNSEEIAKNKRCYANTLRPCSRMLLKVMKGGRGGHYPLGHLRRGGHYPWVILGGGSLSPGSISALRVTGDPAKGDPGGGRPTSPSPTPDND